MIRLLFISLLFISCTGNTSQSAQAEGPSYQEQLKLANPDTLLVGIQDKIYDVFVQSVVSQDKSSLVQLSDQLTELNKTEGQPIITYWRAYLQFYFSIFYLKNSDKENAEKEIDKGIELLEELKKRNSEDNALLAMLQGFGIQFKGLKAMVISMDIKSNIKQAIAQDSTNLRAYYVYGSNDFHTPKKYGGGKKAEQYLLKAISLPAQKVKNPYLPSWGKEESYELLIKLYIKEEKWGLAKKYFQEGISKFPESYTINQLAPKLVD
ncbi:hypothetical protein FKX85_08740 [Echinicola soli]|uniref:Tetratricopeptide repeat protein n=1 Tax=Echinicola soli TaxID=2591634 RepID=A0A514CH24_9BACT|nr:hypothetical protein [Echinicola soli]QDH79117.1 hypothetical protein FKX85_08740 [Echinicola soli]